MIFHDTWSPDKFFTSTVKVSKTSLSEPFTEHLQTRRPPNLIHAPSSARSAAGPDWFLTPSAFAMEWNLRRKRDVERSQNLGNFWNGQAARGGQSFRYHPRQSLQKPLLLLVETWLPQQISTTLRLKSDWKKTCSFFCGGPASEVFFWTANFIKFRALQGVTTNTTETNTFLEWCHQETCITLGANFLTCHIVNIDTPLVKRTWGSPVSSKDVGVPQKMAITRVHGSIYIEYNFQAYISDTLTKSS